jgi:hypothetical protein
MTIYQLFSMFKSQRYSRILCCLTFSFMKILFRAHFHKKKIFRKKLVENLLGSGSRSGQNSFGSATLLIGRYSSRIGSHCHSKFFNMKLEKGKIKVKNLVLIITIFSLKDLNVFLCTVC